MNKMLICLLACCLMLSVSTAQKGITKPPASSTQGKINPTTPKNGAAGFVSATATLLVLPFLPVFLQRVLS
ncbi:hypothetical protein scyTo_0006767 [Scyliorhinus torazame]|uniref:Uncharacterized protein n=1 Tax=Scyliorhinus torazame TaxID=75743 RepID=A0A401PJX6_SCYTO|nr:hypothetical protein [Scyliorhinus torazame]